MIPTLVITILIEGLIGAGYSLWRKKPLVPILSTSVFANILTQLLLWAVLQIFFQHYLMTLLITEILIWLIESAWYTSLRWNRLDLKAALLLSLVMNLSSFGVGWFLPV